MDSMTPVGLGIALALPLKELAERILGPSADVLGTRFAGWTGENLKRVLASASAKAGPGRANPRVTRAVLEEGALTDDIVAAEYFGGMLAAAVSDDGRNDSALPHVALIRAMSIPEIRLHFMVYYGLVRWAFHSQASEDNWWNDRLVVLSAKDVATAMQHQARCEETAVMAICSLRQHQLIAPRYSVNLTHVSDGTAPFAARGVAVVPTRWGLELFGRALGFPTVSPTFLASLDVTRATLGCRDCVPDDFSVKNRVSEFHDGADSRSQLDEFEARLEDCESAIQDLDK